MDKSRLSSIFSELENTISARKIAIRIDCENFETVYVERLGNKTFHVSDNYETFQYLEDANDSVYLDIAKIDMAKIKQICEKNNISLIEPSDEETYHKIGASISESDSIPAVINNVCNAIDEIFDYAHINNHKSL